MRTMRVFVSCLAMGTIAATAGAQQNGGPRGKQPSASQPGQPVQPGGEERQGRPRGGMMMDLAPEKAKAAWEVEARSVAGNLGLNEQQTSAVVKAYSDARESEAKARREMMEKARKDREAGDQGEGGRRGGNFAEMQKARDDAKASLEKALSGTLNAEQTTKAMGVLGTFNLQWDRAVDAITNLKLPADKQKAAVQATQDFVVAVNKARTANQGDREGMQTAMQEAREKLNESLKKVLNDEQLEQVQAAFGPMRGGRGPGGGPGGGRRGGGQGGERPNGGG